MNNLLRFLTDELGRLLKEWLPQLAKDWRERYVLTALTFQQQERVRQSQVSELPWLAGMSHIFVECMLKRSLAEKIDRQGCQQAVAHCGVRR